MKNPMSELVTANVEKGVSITMERGSGYQKRAMRFTMKLLPTYTLKFDYRAFTIVVGQEDIRFAPVRKVEKKECNER